LSLSAEYFDKLYSASDDPWSLASRWYERRKYAVTLASLSRPRYRRAFEPGCSIGVLTEQLAARCDSLLASDISAAALASTCARVDSGVVETAVMRVPDEWPQGRFDLIVVSELAYYLSLDAVDVLVGRCAGSLTPDGELVVVHWRHQVADYPQTAATVHERFRGSPRLTRRTHHEEPDFMLDVLVPPGAPTVAEREGLV
jgi:predicted TPR repeat methyltransferase